MTNIENHIIALKCSWIKRIFTGGQVWLELFKCVFDENSITGLFDFGDEHIQCLIDRCNNVFWKDVLTSWNVFVKKQMDRLKSSTDLALIPIWHNSKITIANKALFNFTWYKKGIKFVIDFLDEKGELLSKTEFDTKFDITADIMYYNSAKSAILSFLREHNYRRDYFKRPVFPFLPSLLKQILRRKKVTKFVYDTVNKNENIKPTSFLKWEENLHFLQDIPSCYEAFKVCFSTTNDSAIQWFQYRLLHRFLPVNKYLKIVGIKSSDSCCFCNNQENIIHAFVTCPDVSQIWTKLSQHIYAKLGIRIGFHFRNIIFGEPFSTKSIAINFIILYTKFFIFKCSRQEKRVQFEQLLKFIHFNYQVQKYIAFSNTQSQLFEENWNVFENIFNIE